MIRALVVVVLPNVRFVLVIIFVSKLLDAMFVVKMLEIVAIVILALLLTSKRLASDAVPIPIFPVSLHFMSQIYITQF